ncbi:MAG: tetratricopeptide repeat protein [Planctomycetota bacterium]
MRRLLIALVGVVVLWSGTAVARDDDDWAEDYRDRLRREITERARRLRDLRDGDYDADRYRDRRGRSRTRGRSNDRDRSDIFTGKYTDPFGPPPKFDPPPNWLFGQGGNAPRDLSGNPMGDIQVGSLLPPATGMTEEERQAKQEEEAAAAKESAANAVEQAQVLFDNAEYGAARRTLVPVIASRRLAQEDIQPAQELLDKIDELGKKKFAEARALAAEGDGDKAAEALTEITEKFAGAPVAKLAQHKLLVLDEEPAVAAAWLLNRAKMFAKKNRMDIARSMLEEVIDHYGDTDAARAARMFLAEQDQKAAAVQMSREQELAARKWLIIGDIQAANGRLAEAKGSYERVAEQFADSRFAEAAVGKIEALRGRRP